MPILFLQLKCSCNCDYINWHFLVMQCYYWRLSSTGTLDAIIKMIRYEGLPGFYKGMSTKIVQSVFAASVLFMIKEELVKAFTVLAVGSRKVILNKVKWYPGQIGWMQTWISCPPYHDVIFKMKHGWQHYLACICALTFSVNVRECINEKPLLYLSIMANIVFFLLSIRLRLLCSEDYSQNLNLFSRD